MPRSDQGVNPERYQVIPRTLIFITHEKSVLLIKGNPTKRIWANRYNGIGGHIERGENVYSAALRELEEETGLSGIPLHLAGTVIVDASPEVGICLFVFRGSSTTQKKLLSSEGSLEWVNADRLELLPLVEDLHVLIPRIMDPRQPFFYAQYFYDEDEKLVIRFSDQTG